MKKAKWLLVGLALTAVLALTVACDSAEAETPNTEGNTIAPIGSNLLASLTSSDLSALAGSLAPALEQWGTSQQMGIWVTGWGKVTLEPDLALLRVGVETRADTVQAARAEAATAMSGIIGALEARGIAERDIQTSFFNISPEYTYQDVYESGRSYRKQVLTGYRVTNNVVVKLRDLDAVGKAIDDVATAGGDATRIQSIQFTVEDSTAAQVEAREKAVVDALAKADQFATLTGVARGNLLLITESGGGVPVARAFEEAAMGMSMLAADVATPISTGEMEIQVSVQAVFAIANP